VQWTPGTRVGWFEILGPLGAGGMGEVYRARDTRLDRIVAIKVLAADVADTGARRARFAREARAAAALNHPHICTLYDVGHHQGYDFIVMELVEGETLASVIARRRERPRDERAIDAGEIQRHAVELARALEAAHAGGIVHRDLKPANIMVTTSGLKVLDFGLAKQRAAVDMGDHGDGVTLEATGQGQLLGTLTYMAPEQVRGEEVDHRADLWSFGAVLFEMIEGHPPFGGRSPADTLSAILKDTAPRLESGVTPPAREVATRFQPILDKCLAKDRAARYQTAAEVRMDLERLAASQSPSPEQSLVVLPFANLSSDPDNAFFADGLTEELITDLSKIHALRVISRTSSMALKGTPKDAPTIARELDVRYVLTGGVRRAVGALRITAQLVDGATDRTVWAEKYSGTIDDVFDLQERLSRAIVDSLRVTLSPEESRRLSSRPLDNAEAHACVIKARQLCLQFSKDALEEAHRQAERARALVGDNPVVLATLAQVYAGFYNIGVSFGADDQGMADQLATRALQQQPDLPPALVVKAWIVIRTAGHRAAIPLLERAVALEPASDALMWLATFNAEIGRDAAARAYAARALALDPLSPVASVLPGWVDMHFGRFSDAVRIVRQAAARAPSDPFILFFVAVVEAHGGEMESAESRFAQVAAADAQIWSTLSRAYAAALRHQRHEVLDVVRDPPLAALLPVDHQYSYWMAECLALVGENDMALSLLATAIRLGMTNHRFFAEHDVFFASLRGEVRFNALMKEAQNASDIMS
jgi:serine/threonine protein kinase